MMNLSAHVSTQTPNIVHFQMDQTENLTTIGIFVSSLLLSLGGCLALVISEVRKSRCTQLKCGQTSCVRDVDEV
jgi:hypothetical protein